VQNAGPGAVFDGRIVRAGQRNGKSGPGRDGRDMRKSHHPYPMHSRVGGARSTVLSDPESWAVVASGSRGLVGRQSGMTSAPRRCPARFDRAGSPAYTALRFSRSWREARREAHLPAEHDCPQAAARVSRAHGLGRRAPRARAPAGQGAQAAVLLSPAPRHARRRTARNISGWYASSVDGSSWPRRPAPIAGWPRRSCSRPGPGRPWSGRAVAQRSAWGSRRAAGSATRSRAIGPSAGYRKRPGTSSQVRPSRGTTTSSSRGRRF
jgi:hypothetical protein